jgi:hypothetical protein
VAALGARNAIRCKPAGDTRRAQSLGVSRTAPSAYATGTVDVEVSLILKRASASASSGQWKDEDYDVLADGKVVGRILESGSEFEPPELRWGWSITAIVPATKGVTNGTAATREEAMAKFRAAWEKAGG